MFIVSYYASPLIHQSLNNTLFNEKIDQEFEKLVSDISNDYHLCYHCIQNHSSFDRLRTLLQEQNSNLSVSKQLTFVGCLFNLLNISNAIVIYLIYGGSLFIFSMCLLHLLLLFGTFSHLTQDTVLLFDCSVIVISFFIMLKCVFSIACHLIDLNLDVEKED